jgi:DNA-binding protein HU-beta
MTKAEFIDALASSKAAEGLSKKAVTELADSVIDVITKAVKKDGKFTYPGFGTWKVVSRKARKGRNPQTGAEIKIAASKSVSFKAAPALKEMFGKKK